MSASALLIVLAAAVCHATWNIASHGASRLGAPFLWWGAVAGAVLWAGVIPLTGGLFLGGGPGDVAGFLLGIAVSAVLHVVYMLVLQRGYASGRLSTVYATARGTGPLLTAIVAVTLLGERPHPLALVGVLAVIAGVVGIGLVDRPVGAARLDAHGEPVRGLRRLDPALVFGLLTGVAIAAYTLWDTLSLRTWSVSPVAYMVGTVALEIPLYTLMLRGRARELLPMARRQWPRILALGVLSPASYILVLWAITMAPVALVAPVREVSVVLVSLFGAFVLRDGRPGWRIAASLVVVAGIVLLAV